MRLSSRTFPDGVQHTSRDSARAVAEQLAIVTLAPGLIRNRFQTLLQHFRSAVERPFADDEAVHQLRVSSRRLTAALETLQSLFADPPRETLIRRLKRIRRAAGPARDLDVFRQRVKSSEFPLKRKSRKRVLQFLKKRRQKAQRPLQKAFRKRSPRKLTKSVDELLAMVASQSGETAASGSGLAVAAVEQFVTDVPATYRTAADLHQLRICGKRLRYTLETLLDLQAIPQRDAAGRLLEELKQIQDRLGKINDHAVSQRRLIGWTIEASRRSLRRAFQQMAELESARADEQTRDFFRWWSTDRQQAFRQRLDDLT
jgi:CHAD domain-containing protein